MRSYDDWKSTDTTDDGDPPECEGERECSGTPSEIVDVARLSGNEGAPSEARMCARCARWTRDYWRREAAAERI